MGKEKAEKFIRDLAATNLFALQDELTDRIVATVGCTDQTNCGELERSRP